MSLEHIFRVRQVLNGTQRRRKQIKHKKKKDRFSLLISQSNNPLLKRKRVR